MKTISIILISLIIVVSGSIAQTTDSISSRQKNKQERNKFVDQNGDGIQDSPQVNKIRQRDVFIDANGDGICDNREQGLGFRRGKGQSTNQTGKRQQGRQK
ncbi:MAG: hypothetical protein Q8L88_08130 [Bacteroidota bacterium]|nr:hypothetical protein [Bacteroidota bacterium]